MGNYEELVKRLRDAATMSDALSVLLPNAGGNAVAKLHRDAADAIEELTRENESLAKSVNEASEILRRRWIPVTERVPSENGFYLCLYNHNHPGGVAMDEGLSILQWFCGRWNLNEIYTVTHWMPIPEPPKEEA